MDADTTKHSPADAGAAAHRIDLSRVGTHRYRVRNVSGDEIEFGRGEGLFSPVELLLAAIAGCSSIDVDTVTSRHTEFTGVDVSAEGRRIEEDGASRLADIRLSFSLAFPEDETGRRSRGDGRPRHRPLPRQALHRLPHGEAW